MPQNRPVRAWNSLLTYWGVPEVFSCIRGDNTPSLAVARRNGMELCGRFSKHYYGQDMEHLLYVARKESWGL